MSQPTANSDAGYVWIGDLADVRVTARYAACHSLRFTGRLDLRDENHSAQITFLGGDPVEIQGGDTQVISLWQVGQFRAAQSLPNLTGELTGQIEQTGSLAITKAPRLLAWVSEYRLSCNLSIERPGEQALLVFRNGQLETADVNGKPELSALVRVQGWTDGFYRVHLKPLFEGGLISLRPPAHDGAAPGGREFDLSRSIPLDLKKQTQLHSPQLGMLAVNRTTDAPIDAERLGEAARTGQPSALPRISTGTEPVVPAATRVAPARREGSSRWPWVLLLLLALGGGGMGAAYFLHLPPFAPLRGNALVVADMALSTATATDLARVTPVVIDEPTPLPDLRVTEAPADLASRVAVVEKPVEAKNLEPKNGDEHARPVTPPVAGVSVEERLIEKGRFLLMDGHPHSALSLFRKAEQSAPRNLLAKTLQQQALGKLGRAELVIEGKGRVNVDGKDFDAPKKLKVYAGPHAVDTGKGPTEVTLKKGEHKKLRPER